MQPLLRTLLVTLLIAPSLSGILIKTENREQKILDLQLEEAIEKNDPSTIKELYEEGADGSTLSVDPIACACHSKSPKALKILLEKGFDYNESYVVGEDLVLKKASDARDNVIMMKPWELADNDPEIIHVFQSHGIRTTRSNNVALLRQATATPDPKVESEQKSPSQTQNYDQKQAPKKGCFYRIIAALNIFDGK